MNILVISSEVWKDSSNGGNVLSSIFKGTNFCISQIYCNAGTPKNDICDNYLQITESSSLKSLLKKQDPFSPVKMQNSSNINADIDPLKKKFHFFKTPFFVLAREILYILSKWKKSPKLAEFIKKADPDIIFAPCYFSPFMQKLDYFLLNKINKPVIGYVSDDIYSLKQFNLSIFYWINRLWTRKLMRKNIKKYSLVYTMTEDQKTEYSGYFNVPFKILTKDSLHKPIINNNLNTSKKIRIIYAGGVYLNRFKNLITIKKMFDKLGAEIVFDVYTNSSPSIINKLVNCGINVFDTLSYEILLEKYKEYDISIHTESFDLSNKYKTRLSFSTKIVDCLSSGNAVFCYGPKNNAGIKVLKDNDAAICCFTKKELKQAIINIMNDRKILHYYSEKAVFYANKHYWEKKNSAVIINDFIEVKNA